MKNRRLAITSFILIAVLVMGIGFAALVDTLNITGTATFRPAAVVETDVDAAIYFTDATPNDDYCVSATVKADPDEAGMTVVFNDAGEVNRRYEASATFTVVYQPSNNAHLPAVKLDTVASAIVPGTATEAQGFTVLVDHIHVNAEGEEIDKELFEPGDTMLIVVTVICNADQITNTTSNSAANISVALNYSTIATNDASEGE